MASLAAAETGKGACDEHERVGVQTLAGGSAACRTDSGSPAKRRKVGESESKTDTVKFNVGGHVFEVLREPTLSLHPGTLLSTLAEEHSGDDPIFVEANPELFPYILEYLRSRSIHIPITVSKGAVLAEAARLGLTSIADGDIRQDISELGALCNVSKTISEKVQEKHQHFRSLIEDARLPLIGPAILSVISDKFTKATVFDKIGCTDEEIGMASGLKTEVVRAILGSHGDHLAHWVRKHGVEVVVCVSKDRAGNVQRRDVKVKTFHRDC